MPPGAIGLLAGGGALTLAGVGQLAGAWATGHQAQAQGVTYEEWSTLGDRGRALNTGGIALSVIGGALAIGGTVWTIVRQARAEQPQIAEWHSGQEYLSKTWISGAPSRDGSGFRRGSLRFLSVVAVKSWRPCTWRGSLGALPDEPKYARVRRWQVACLAHPSAQQVTREEIVKLYYDYSRGVGNGALPEGRTVSSVAFEPHWSRRPMPPRAKYDRNATDAELGLV